MPKSKKGVGSFIERKVVRKLSRKLAAMQLSEAGTRVRSEGLTYLSTRRLLNLENCMKQIRSRGIEGDILEFGVALGGSGILLSQLMGPGRRYYGFDVFGMIPSPNPNVDGKDSIERYNVIATGKSKGISGRTYYGYEENLLEKVSTSFKKHGLQDGSQFVLYKGLFETEWPRVESEIQSAALIHIDCDWHDPVAYCLEVAAKKLAIGGYVIVDDYNDYEGANKAVKSFLRRCDGFKIVKNSENLILSRHA